MSMSLARRRGRREVVLALRERDFYEHVTGEEKRSDEKSTTKFK
jgi:hypothetical protein